jgi:hypothetical protein
MSTRSRIVRLVFGSVALGLMAAPAFAGDPEDPARIRRAMAYLDGRQDEWAQFSKAQRGEGADKTACVSCHSGLGYVLARPGLRAFGPSPAVSPPEQRILAAAHLRVEHRSELDSPRFELMYDFEDRKKVESRSTEAVLNALILAREDAAQSRTKPSEATKSALADLWASQTTEGKASGAWDWLNFGLEPWEASGSPAFGASLAAIAVGTAPGYLRESLDEKATRGLGLLKDYLRRRFPDESLYNRLWILEASSRVEGLLSAEQKQAVIDQLLAVRRDDGGWSLATLGVFQRGDGTPQPQKSDGHATGLIVDAMLRAGVPVTRPEVAQGLAWLRTHQQEDGSWTGWSLNKERDPKTFVGKFMTDSSTAMAAMALAESASN